MFQIVRYQSNDIGIPKVLKMVRMFRREVPESTTDYAIRTMNTLKDKTITFTNLIILGGYTVEILRQRDTSSRQIRGQRCYKTDNQSSYADTLRVITYYQLSKYHIRLKTQVLIKIEDL